MTKAELPAYWLSRPDFRPDREAAVSFDRLLDAALDRGPDRPVYNRLDAPKRQFLCHVVRMAADPGGFPWSEAGRTAARPAPDRPERRLPASPL